MLYTGGLFNGGVSVASAFANCDAINGLAMGAAYTVIFVAILYLPRKIVAPKQYLDGLVKGFINMVPATLILVFAWTLSGVCGADYLNAGGFVANVVETYHMNLHFMPAVFFCGITSCFFNWNFMGNICNNASDHNSSIWRYYDSFNHYHNSGCPRRKRLW